MAELESPPTGTETYYGESGDPNWALDILARSDYWMDKDPKILEGAQNSRRWYLKNNKSAWKAAQKERTGFSKVKKWVKGKLNMRKGGSVGYTQRWANSRKKNG